MKIDVTNYGETGPTFNQHIHGSRLYILITQLIIVIRLVASSVRDPLRKIDFFWVSKKD